MGLLSAIAAVIGGLFSGQSKADVYDHPAAPANKRRPVSIKPNRHIKKPKGTKKYYFDKDGKFVNKIADGVDIVLVVIAINDHNAQRKFWKWKATQTA